MSKALLIVESPAKVKTMSKFLGKDYLIKSSIGHIRDLPTGTKTKKTKEEKPAKSAKSTLSREELAYARLKEKMGIDPENHWNAHYEILPGKEKVVRDLKASAKECDKVILATDLDREGEAIAWHLSEILGKHKYERIVFNAITEDSIKEALAHPLSLDTDKIHAQHTRRFLDRVVGYTVSPLLWEKLAPGLSAGRVQSIALKILAEREEEIRKFVPVEYWNIFADFTNKITLTFDLLKYKNKKIVISNKTEALDFEQKIKSASPFMLANIDEKPSASSSPSPFTTSSLQQVASNRFGYSIKQTMGMAQQLYEQGYITYMRTDSTNISPGALKNVHSYIKKTYGDTYLHSGKQSKNSKFSQEAHECIRPTSLSTSPSSIKPELQSMYRLIRAYFIASQMSDAKYTNHTISLEKDSLEFVAKSKDLVFDGYLKELPFHNQADKTPLPKVKIGEKWDLAKLTSKQNFTKPPSRYSEATLVNELEKSGIGRPSTYVPTISNLQERGYVRVEQKKIFVEKIGELVVYFLEKQFKNLMRVEFTADMETQLDAIANGKLNWEATLNKFYDGLKDDIAKAKADKDPLHKSIETHIKCDKCSRDMQIKFGSTGVFLGCSGFFDKKDSCKNTTNLTKLSGLASIAEDEEMADFLVKSEKCPKCSNILENFLLPDGKTMLKVCGNAPICQYFATQTGDYSALIPAPQKSTLICDSCGSEMVAKTGRFGDYIQCTNESCKKTRKILKNGEVAPMMMSPIPLPSLKCLKCDDFYVLREGLAGLFLAASKFPKNRETRSPLILELKPILKDMPEKFAFLADAPLYDDAGNPSVLGFNKKTKHYTVSSIKDGKKTKFMLEYDGKKWG